ncbi:hypothetical protein FOXYSP1_16811 [Fusarium oxysporum f. sp. phaseoli]
METKWQFPVTRLYLSGLLWIDKPQVITLQHHGDRGEDDLLSHRLARTAECSSSKRKEMSPQASNGGSGALIFRPNMRCWPLWRFSCGLNALFFRRAADAGASWTIKKPLSPESFQRMLRPAT